MNGEKYLSCRSDVITLYDEDRKSDIGLTKLTNTSLHTKPLQRQSVPLVSQVSNDKTVAAFKVLKGSIKYNEGTVIFIQLVTDWFKMMNVKDKYTAIRLRDELRSPWELNCVSFTKLMYTCNIINSCKRGRGGKRIQTLTLQTANAFMLTTENNIEAAKHLLENHNFNYILPAVNSQDPAEKFFGQARHRCGGNFYIDIVDVMAVEKMQVLHQLLKHDLLLDKSHSCKCPSCTQEVNPDDIDVVRDLTITETQSLLQTSDQLKHTVIYISGYISKKHHLPSNEAEECISSEFLDKLNRGRLTIPTLSRAFFVHTGIRIQNLILTPETQCRSYLMKLLSFTDAPIAKTTSTHQSLANILLKLFVMAKGDKEQSISCLQRKEKPQDE